MLGSFSQSTLHSHGYFSAFEVAVNEVVIDDLGDVVKYACAVSIVSGNVLVQVVVDMLVEVSVKVVSNVVAVDSVIVQ